MRVRRDYKRKTMDRERDSTFVLQHKKADKDPQTPDRRGLGAEKESLRE